MTTLAEVQRAAIFGEVCCIPDTRQAVVISQSG
jgi:hypothetical protein